MPGMYKRKKANLYMLYTCVYLLPFLPFLLHFCIFYILIFHDLPIFLPLPFWIVFFWPFSTFFSFNNLFLRLHVSAIYNLNKYKQQGYIGCTKCLEA